MDQKLVKEKIDIMRKAGASPVYCDALYYHHLGFNVIPVPTVNPKMVMNGETVPVHKQKNPVIKWKQYQLERVTETQLQQWFSVQSQKWTRYGFITGQISGFVIVDPDNEKGLEWCRANLPATPMRVEGLPGHEHWYYRYPINLGPAESIANRAKFDTGFPKGVADVDIRGHGGFVMGAGSLHPLGHLYKPAVPFDEIDFESIPYFDPAWVPGCIKDNSKRVTFGDDVLDAHADIFAQTIPVYAWQAAATYLKRTKGAIQDSGDAKGYIVSCKLIHDYRMDRKNARDLLDKFYKYKCDSKDWDSWIEHKLDNALKYGEPTPGFVLREPEEKAQELAVLERERVKQTVEEFATQWLAKQELSYHYRDNLYKNFGKAIRPDHFLQDMRASATQARTHENHEIWGDRDEYDRVLRNWTQEQIDALIKKTIDDFAYDGSDAKEHWDNFMQMVFLEPDEKDYVVMKHFILQVKRKYLGLPIFYPIMPILHGPQRVGKTAVLRLLLKPIEEFWKTMPNLQNLTDTRWSQVFQKNYVLFLDDMGKNNGVDVAVSLIKSIMSDPHVTHRPLGKDDVVSIPNNTTWLGASNEDIQDLIYDPTGMGRFWQIDTKDKLFNWDVLKKVDFMAMWKSIDHEKDHYLGEHVDAIQHKQNTEFKAKDSVEQWLESCELVNDPHVDNWEQAHSLYLMYAHYCERSRLKGISESKWGRLLPRKYNIRFEIRPGKKKFYAITTCALDEEAERVRQEVLKCEAEGYTPLC